MSGLATEDRLANVPRQVREAMEASSAKVAALTPPDPGNDAPVAAPEVTVETPPVQPSAPTPPPATQPVQQTQQAPVSVSEPPKDDWKNRYDNLEQVYRTQEGRLRKANEELNRLKAQVEVLERVGHKPADQAKSSAGSPSDEDLALARQLLSEEELDYGDDIPRMVLKLTRAELERREKQQQPSKEATQQPQQQLAADFWDGLRRLVPDFEAVDRDPGFLAWLRGPDGLSNRTRQELLLEARDAEDPVAVARVFQAYKDAAARPKTNPHPTVQEQVAPATAPGMPGSNQGAKTYGLQEWNKAMVDLTRNGDLTAKQKEELHRELRAAAREGRVQGLPA